MSHIWTATAVLLVLGMSPWRILQIMQPKHLIRTLEALRVGPQFQVLTSRYHLLDHNTWGSRTACVVAEHPSTYSRFRQRTSRPPKVKSVSRRKKSQAMSPKRAANLLGVRQETASSPELVSVKPPTDDATPMRSSRVNE